MAAFLSILVSVYFIFFSKRKAINSWTLYKSNLDLKALLLAILDAIRSVISRRSMISSFSSVLFSSFYLIFIVPIRKKRSVGNIVSLVCLIFYFFRRNFLQSLKTRVRICFSMIRRGFFLKNRETTTRERSSRRSSTKRKRVLLSRSEPFVVNAEGRPY